MGCRAAPSAHANRQQIERSKERWRYTVCKLQCAHRRLVLHPPSGEFHARFARFSRRNMLAARASPLRESPANAPHREKERERHEWPSASLPANCFRNFRAKRAHQLSTSPRLIGLIFFPLLSRISWSSSRYPWGNRDASCVNSSCFTKSNGCL